MTRIETLFEDAKTFYENGDPGHDVEHISRVMENCRLLSQNEDANLEILLAAAMLHDVVNLAKNHPERLQASQMAAEKSKSILTKARFSRDEIDTISSVITEHSYSLGRKPSSKESAILQDADKLDAIGAIGIMRAVTCGGRLGSSYYHTEDPLAERRSPDERAYTIDHFFTKLFKLPDLMNTPGGKAEANRRVDFMRAFLGQLKSEIDGSSK